MGGHDFLYSSVNLKALRQSHLDSLETYLRMSNLYI